MSFNKALKLWAGQNQNHIIQVTGAVSLLILEGSACFVFYLLG